MPLTVHGVGFIVPPMTGLGALLTLWLAFPSHAINCTAVEAEMRLCINASYADSAILAPPTDPTITDWLVTAIRHSSLMRASEAAFAGCAARYESFQSSCPLNRAELALSWVSAIAIRTATYNDGVSKLKYLISAANGRASGNERYALPCFQYTAGNYNYPLCFVVDRRETASRLRYVLDADDLPLRVGSSEDCTFYVDELNRILTADHCGMRHLARAWPLTQEFEEVSAVYKAGLAYSAANYNGGGPFEDLALFSVPSPHRLLGKTSYHLALDEKMDVGCELRPGGILACSQRALVDLATKKAESLSFPSSIYVGHSGEGRRDRPLSVLHTKGPLFYEPRLERFFYHGFSRWGSSGAPVFIPAGQDVGGVPLDRPLVIGVISGSVSASANELGGDVMSVVGVVRYRRLALLLRDARPAYATGNDL